MAFTLAHRSQSIVHSPKLQVDTFPARRVFLVQSSSFVRRFSLALILLPQRTSLLMRSLLVGFTLIVMAIAAPMMAAQLSLIDRSSSFVRRFSLALILLPQRTSLLMRSLLVGFTLIVMAIAAPMMAAQKVELSIDASKTGAKIARNIFGQFAEHLGHGIYEGIWVGPDSKIPNTRGIRNDVVGALKAIKVPNVRWPGGCFADEYHWRKSIGPQRSVTLNPNWGGVTEANTFGTHEFMDFLDQIGADAYVSVNVGSGTPQEAAEWLEYMTAAAPTTLVKERAANGHPAPYKVALLGIGNESWDCGGNMTPDYYVSQMKIYSRFVRNFNNAQQEKQKMLKIDVGPEAEGTR